MSIYGHNGPDTTEQTKMTNYHKLFEAIGVIATLVALFCLGNMIAAIGN
jgi:hypothetical protein